MAIPEIIWNHHYCKEVPPPYLASFADALEKAVSKSGLGPNLIRDCIICCMFEQAFDFNQNHIVKLKIVDIQLIKTILAVSQHGEFKFLVVNFYEVFGPILEEHIVAPK